jgi:hypothetical protein
MNASSLQQQQPVFYEHPQLQQQNQQQHQQQQGQNFSSQYAQKHRQQPTYNATTTHYLNPNKNNNFQQQQDNVSVTSHASRLQVPPYYPAINNINNQKSSPRDEHSVHSMQSINSISNFSMFADTNNARFILSAPEVQTKLLDYNISDEMKIQLIMSRGFSREKATYIYYKRAF